MFLEVIATSIKDIEKINNSLADQVELCTAMEFGGYTANYKLIVEACKISLKPVMVMVRNNNGFTITAADFKVFEKDIAFIKTTNAHGIVCGILTKDNKIDMQKMRKLIKLAKPLTITFHRAFDEILGEWRRCW